jgi:hypothetical protein
MLFVVSVLVSKAGGSITGTRYVLSAHVALSRSFDDQLHSTCECHLLRIDASQGNYNRSRAITYSQLFNSSLDATFKITTSLIPIPTTRRVLRRIHLRTPTTTTKSTWLIIAASPRSLCLGVSSRGHLWCLAIRRGQGRVVCFRSLRRLGRRRQRR